MKRPSKEIKRIARDMLNNRYQLPMWLFIIATLIPTIISSPFPIPFGEDAGIIQIIVPLLAQYLILLISQVFGIGVVYVHLNMTRGYEFQFRQLFYPFKNGTDRFIGGAFILTLLSFVCCIPAIGGAIYFYFADLTILSVGILSTCCIMTALLLLLIILNYSFVLYLLLDDPQIKVLDAFRETRQLMKGNRARFFYILFSFLGWKLLNLCSLGIASLWVEPYCTQILVTFYLDCTGELNRIPVRKYEA